MRSTGPRGSVIRVAVQRQGRRVPESEKKHGHRSGWTDQARFRASRVPLAMSSGDVILVLVVVAALSFDFTNGFHDTANAMAMTIATGALPPGAAVTIAAILNFAGAFISLKVAATIAGGIVEARAITPTVVLGGLIGAIAWNLATWWFGLPLLVLARADRRHRGCHAGDRRHERREVRRDPLQRHRAGLRVAGRSRPGRGHR